MKYCIAVLIVISTMSMGGVASGAVELITNGGFDDGGFANGTGWDNTSDARFVGSHYFPGGVGHIAPRTGEGMAVLSWGTIFSAAISQDIPADGFVGDVAVSFSYQLAALDFTPIFESWDSGDFLVVSIGGEELLNVELDDPSHVFCHHIDLNATSTGWIDVGPITVPLDQLLANPDVTISFFSDNDDPCLQQQLFTAYVDNVSVLAPGGEGDPAGGVPEPATLIIWSVFGAIGLFGRRQS